MSYGYSSDNLEKLGFINKNKILEYVSEKDIYELVFGFKPEEYQYVTSPLREDDEPGCWFETTEFGLVFRDFSYKNRPLDCFDVVQDYFNIPNFYQTLEFVYEKLIKHNPIVQRQEIIQKEAKADVEILCESRNYVRHDSLFWMPYGISKQNLIDDKVFAFRKFTMLNTRAGDFTAKVRRQLAYAFTDFPDGRKKLYFPEKKNKADRFITNCKKNDIGNVNQLVPYGRLLIISKSYKDCRVLRNLGFNSIWIQNEGMMPDTNLLISIVKRFTHVIVFYDNDETGIRASIKLTELLNSHFPGKANPLWLPETLNQQGITDPADLYKARGKEELIQFLSKL